MKKTSFTIRPTSEIFQEIEELSKLMGVSKNKLVVSILERSSEEIKQTILLLKEVKKPLNGGYSSLHNDVKNLVTQDYKNQLKLKEYKEQLEASKTYSGSAFIP